MPPPSRSDLARPITQPTPPMSVLLQAIEMPTDRFKGLVAVVSGGGSGLGANVARTLAAAGAKVVVIDPHEDGASVVKGIRGVGGTAEFIPYDLAVPEGVTTAIAQAVATLGPIDLLVNAPAAHSDHSPQAGALENWQYLHTTHLQAPYLAIRAVLPGMLDRDHGVIANCLPPEDASSLAAVDANTGALRALTSALAKEVGSEAGVHIMGVQPSWAKRPPDRLSEVYCALSVVHFIAHAAQHHGQQIDPVAQLVASGVFPQGTTSDPIRLKPPSIALGSPPQPVHADPKMAALGQLAGGVSHEMNNMLTVVLSGVSSAIESLTPYHPAMAALSGVKAAAEHSRLLSRQLVTFSQKQSLRLVQRELWSAVNRRLPALRGRLGPSIEVELTARSTPVHVAFDSRQLGELLDQLANNAAAAMPDGGQLCLTVKKDPDPESASALLVVHDTGVGMSATIVQRAFEPFFTTQTFGHGAGMGLALVYGIVRALEGEVELSSSQGTGTTVTIRLPSLPAPAADADADADIRPSDVPQAGPMLVVCQDNLVRRVLARMLHRESSQVIHARSRTEASSLLASADPPFDLMVVEITSNARQAQILSWVRSHQRPGLGIINLVGPRVPDTMEDRLRGYGEILRKPFTVDDLRQAMHRARTGVEDRGLRAAKLARNGDGPLLFRATQAKSG